MNQQERKALTDCCFVKRGNAFFRVYGDGILQVVKWQQGEWFAGVFSLYSELQPQWFTSSGCIPHYSACELATTQRKFVTTNSVLLIDVVLPWLEEAKTHRKMLDCILELDVRRTGAVCWIDALKIAPFLMCDEYTSAEQVINAILKNHRFALRFNRPLFNSERDYQRYAEQQTREDMKFEVLLKAIRQRDDNLVQKYLLDNYEQNSNYAQFCRRR